MRRTLFGTVLYSALYIALSEEATRPGGCSKMFYTKCFIRNVLNLLFSFPGSLFISSPFEGELNGDRGLIMLEKTMVSVLHKELE